MIKVTDVLYGRLQAPDLDRMEAFLTAFGMHRADRTPTALYMRGTDSDHHIHVTERGDSRFVGVAFGAESVEDLERLATLDGASAVEEIDAPGGGRRVTLSDPDGVGVEVVHGIATLDPLPVRANVVNTGDARLRRAGQRKSLAPGPAHVKRIGHVGLVSPDPRRSRAWYREVLGFRGSDEIIEGDERNVVASFNRVDRGGDFVDHHSLLCIQGSRSGLNHLAFEVSDLDDLLIGHDHLREIGGYQHMWGPGRHVIGSQVFDYWLCPWGHLHEHWTDSDMLNSDDTCVVRPRGQGVVGSQWGPPPPQAFVDQVS